MEYPGLKLAVITEGQSGGVRKRPRPVKKEATNRQKLKSYADLSPGDWWSTSTTAWAAFWR